MVQRYIKVLILYILLHFYLQLLLLRNVYQIKLLDLFAYSRRLRYICIWFTLLFKFKRISNTYIKAR